MVCLIRNIIRITYLCTSTGRLTISNKERMEVNRRKGRRSTTDPAGPLANEMSRVMDENGGEGDDEEYGV